MNTLPPEQRTTAIALMVQGESLRSVGRHMGVDKDTLVRLLEKMEWAAALRRWPLGATKGHRTITRTYGGGFGPVRTGRRLRMLRALSASGFDVLQLVDDVAEMERRDACLPRKPEMMS